MSEALILTARFEARAQDYFQRMRDAHFPAELNIVPAHLTLFHKLPGEEHAAIVERLSALAAETPPLPATVADVRFFGRGGGFTVRCEGLDEVRARLRKAWEPWLAEQDRQPHKAHVTYQNKVTKERAKATYEEVLGGFGAFATQVVALDLWWYRRHWDAAGTFPLGSDRPSLCSPASTV